MAENDYLLSGGLEGIGSTGKKCEVARRRNGLDTNKRKKAKKGQPDAIDGGPTGRELNIGQASFHSEPSNASNQFIPDQLMQGHYVLDHNFGPGFLGSYLATAAVYREWSTDPGGRQTRCTRRVSLLPEDEDVEKRAQARVREDEDADRRDGEDGAAMRPLAQTRT
uniref:Uncharacterized protein n=1 Tax=Zea mays TaxID=4577 RepID=A0A804MPM1_MAIZE